MFINKLTTYFAECVLRYTIGYSRKACEYTLTDKHNRIINANQELNKSLARAAAMRPKI